MSLTVPEIIKAYARGGGSIVFLLDIEPSAADSWTTKRFATNAVTVGSTAYTDAILGGLTRIGFEAKVIQGGNVVTLPDTDIKLINKSKLHESFVVDNIEGRRAVVKMTAVSPNMCLNSSFEKHTGDFFYDWDLNPGAGGGSITAETGIVFDNATACKLTGGTEGSYVKTNEASITWRVGSKLIVSCYARTPSGTATLKAAIHVGTSVFWYNATTQDFVISRCKNTMGTANSTEWQRFLIVMDWKAWLDAISGSPELVDQYIYVEFWCEPSETVIIDAVEIELNNQMSVYHHNRHELDSDDVCTVFTGIVKNPEWNSSEISLSLEAWESNKHRDIPKAILTESTDATWKVPKESLGKPFPITYGDFNADDLTVWDPKNTSLTEFAAGLLCNVDQTNPANTNVLIYFDRPGIKLHTFTRLYDFCEDDNRYYEQMYWDKSGYAYSARELISDIANHPRWKSATTPCWLNTLKMPLMAYLKCTSFDVGETHASWTDADHIYDGVLSTYGYKDVVFPGPAEIRLKMEAFPVSVEDLMRLPASDPAEIYILGDYELSGGTAAAVYLEVFITGKQGETAGFLKEEIFFEHHAPCAFRNTPIKRGGGDPPATNLLTDLYLSTGTTYNETVLADSIFKLKDSSDQGGGTRPVLKVYEAGILIYFILPLDRICYACQMKGRTFGATWGGRKTATNMVESAPEVIESIIRDELGAADADINTTMFDAADTARSQAAAGQLLEVKNSMDVIKDICDEYGLLYYIDILGKHSLINLDWRSVTKHLFLHDWYKPFSDVKISYTPRADIVNDITLHYDKNQFTGDYRKVAFCNKDGCSGSIGASYVTKCSNSYTQLGNKVQAIELECDWIKSTTTAEAMVKWTIDWLYKQRLMITGDLFLDNLDLALGDIVDVDMDTLLPKAYTTGARFMAISTIINRQNSRLSVKLLEVKQP